MLTDLDVVEASLTLVKILKKIMVEDAVKKGAIFMNKFFNL